MRCSSKLFVSVAAAVALSGCGSGVPQAIAEQEQVDYYFQRLQPDANGQYALKMDLGSGCRDYLFTAAGLADALRTKQFQHTHNLGSGPVTVTASLTLDAITTCHPATAGEVKFVSAQLSEPFTDANGNPAKRRPKDPNTLLSLVVTELSNGGVLNVGVNGFKLIGTTVSRSDAPGPITISTAEVPAGQVGGSSDLFAQTNLNPAYAEAELTNVLTNPNRFTVTFAFLAKTDPTSNEILLVWDGDMVLRTDIED
jgi:hypothetical protein